MPKKIRTTTKATTFAKIRCFLRAAFRREWIEEPLVDKVTTVKALYNQKEPYTDEEVRAILDHAQELDGGTHGYAKQPRTFRLLLELMLATGLRVGDAVGFDPRALTKGVSLWIYTYQPQKQKRADKPKVLEAYITDEMKKRIDECTWLSTRGPFWYGTGLNPTPLAQAVYERMQGIGNRTSTLALNHVKQIQGIASTARGLSEITVDVALIGARVTAQPARRPALVPAQDAEARGDVRATFQRDLRCGIPRAFIIAKRNRECSYTARCQHAGG